MELDNIFELLHQSCLSMDFSLMAQAKLAGPRRLRFAMGPGLLRLGTLNFQTLTLLQQFGLLQQRSHSGRDLQPKAREIFAKA